MHSSVWSPKLKELARCENGFAGSASEAPTCNPDFASELLVVPKFLPKATAQDWYERLCALIEPYTAYISRSLESPADLAPERYRTAQFMRGPCTCKYDYAGTARHKSFSYKLGNDVGPSILDEIEDHFMNNFGFEDVSSVPDCWVVNVYEEDSKYIPWHADDDDIFDAVMHPADIVLL